MGWLAALGVALIGQELPEATASAQPPSGAEVAAALADAGFEPSQLAELVRQRQTAELPWPFPVSAEQRGDIGAAQFFSVLRAVTDELDVHAWHRAKPIAPTGLTAADRRLLADRPPHWG